MARVRETISTDGRDVQEAAGRKSTDTGDYQLLRQDSTDTSDGMSRSFGSVQELAAPSSSQSNYLDELPCVSLSMFQIFKVCDLDDPEIILFYLHCRHIRVVRWSGHRDSGRVEVTII